MKRTAMSQRARRSASSRDDGQIMLLSLVYGLLVLLLVTAVVSASSVHLERKRLLALADLTALAAADALDEAAYYSRSSVGPDRGLVVVTPTTVRQSAEAHLLASPASADFEHLTLVAATTPDSRTAEVTLAAVARPPLLSQATAAWSDGIRIQVTASARAG